MKKIFLFLFVSSITFAQTGQTKSLIELKYQAAENRFTSTIGRNEESTKQDAETGIRNASFEIQQGATKKNAGLAILFSMILPGMGELYANGYETGKYFTIADGVLWGVFTGFNSYGKWKEDNYRSFAQSKAGVNLDGKEADFFANVGGDISVDEYNKTKELERDFINTYNSPDYYWKWQSESDRKEYRNMWTSSEAAYTNVRFVAGALILNRLISVINAVRLVSAYNKNLGSQTEIGYYFSYQQSATLPSSINFNIVKTF